LIDTYETKSSRPLTVRFSYETHTRRHIAPDRSLDRWRRRRIGLCIDNEFDRHRYLLPFRSAETI
jgi:hypothetical protein